MGKAIVDNGNSSDIWKAGAISTMGNYIGNNVAGGFNKGAGINNAYSTQLVNNFNTFAARKILWRVTIVVMKIISIIKKLLFVLQNRWVKLTKLMIEL